MGTQRTWISSERRCRGGEKFGASFLLNVLAQTEVTHRFVTVPTDMSSIPGIRGFFKYDRLIARSPGIISVALSHVDKHRWSIQEIRSTSRTRNTRCAGGNLGKLFICGNK